MRRRASSLLLLLLLTCACGGPPVTPSVGSPGDLLEDSAIFDAVRRVISEAKVGIEVEMYEFGRVDLAEALARARSRGVLVRVVLDPTVVQDRPTAVRLTQADVQVRWYPVDDRRGQIDHVKLLIGDSGALVGGMNWGTHSAANHDYAVEDRDAADLVRLRAIFDQDWSLAGGVPHPLVEITGAVAQTAPGAEIRHRLEGSLAGARTRVLAEVFALSDPDILAGLAAARRRGVVVRVLLDPGQEVNRAAFLQLQQAGVAVAWYPVVRGAKLHAKAGLFDGLLVIGSANWSRHGLGVNHELDLATKRARAVAAFEARFAKDWEAAAR